MFGLPRKIAGSRALTLIALATVLLCGCSPLSPEARKKVDPHLDYAAVLANPDLYTDRFILTGGAVVSLSDKGDGSLLVLQRWEMSRYGVLLAMAEAGDLVLVDSPTRLDPQAFAVGRLVTLCGKVIGRRTVPGDREGAVALNLKLDEINLIDTPYRYGLRRNDDPSNYTRTPTYLPPDGPPGAPHPYDSSSLAYPYSPFTYRLR